MMMTSIHDFIAPKIILTEDAVTVFGQYYFGAIKSWIDRINMLQLLYFFFYPEY
jgi:hypothetical protein